MSRGNQVVWPLLALVTSFVALLAVTWLSSTDRQRVDTPSSAPPVSVPVPTPEGPTPPPPSELPSEPASEPPTVLMVTIAGPEPYQDRQPPQPPVTNYAIVVGVLDRMGDQVCLNPSFADRWRPQNEDGWTFNGTTRCRPSPPGIPLALTFVWK